MSERGPTGRDPGPPDGQGRAAAVRWLAIGLIALFAAVMASIAQHRVVGDYLKETDFYHLYAPDADRIRSGHPPASTFNTGPGYPLLLALAFPGDHFESGKWISLATAVVTALAAFELFRALFGSLTACLGLLFVLTSADFARFSVQATTDMPFLAVAVLAILAISRGITGGGWTWIVLGDPRSPMPWLRPVYVNPDAPLIVYAVALDGRCHAGPGSQPRSP